jgi:histidyl-tRNA synthetase
VSRYLPTAPSRGTRDFLPAEMSVRQQTFHRLYEVIERYGFVRYDGPILEPVEIYEAKSGREIAEKQLYSLQDRGDRRLALRPEMTPTAARMIAANVNTLHFPVRWYSHPNCHRYERPQRGRVREHWQINVDIFGSDSHRCEIEIFEMIHDMMGALGAPEEAWVLRVSDRGLLSGALTELVGVPREAVRDVFGVIDRWEKYPREALEADAGELGLDQAAFRRLEAVLDGGSQILGDLSQEVRDASPVATILATGAADLFTFDPHIVRGLAYYTSTVFEVFDRHPANNRALFGGGRYSDLVALFSDRKIPGLGFGFGDVTLFDFLDVHDLTCEPRSESDVTVIPLDPSLLDPAWDLAMTLRRAGLRTTVPFEPRKLGKELTRAAGAGNRLAVIVGERELAAGEVLLRDLRTRDQRAVALADVARTVTETLA